MVKANCSRDSKSAVMCMMDLLLQRDDALHLHERSARKRRYADGTACGVGLTEVLRHDFVQEHGVREIRQIRVDFDDGVESRAGSRDDRLEILEDSPDLRLGIALDQFVGLRIQRNLAG